MSSEQSGHSKTRRKRVLSLVVVVLVAFAGILLLTVMQPPGKMDYIEYWSSGKLIVQHANPYSPSKIFALESGAGAPYSRPLIMLNPPWALFLVAPLGFCGIYGGLFLWQVVIIGCVIASILLLNRHASHGPLALVFAPVVACLCSGQSAPFLLLGFVLFLHYHRSRPFVAGASLLLMAIKPHLFLVFLAVLLIDCIYRRRFLILAGAASSLAAATVVSLCFDPHIWSHYLETVRGYQVQHAFLPTASMLFRMAIDVRIFWLLFIPSLVGIVWGVWYYFRWKGSWDWKTHGMLLMLVTILVSPYGFFSDEIVLLPSIAFAIVYPYKRKYSGWMLLIVNTAALCVVAFSGKLTSPWFIWTPTAWLLWFLYATRGFRRVGEQAIPASDTVQIAGLEGAYAVRTLERNSRNGSPGSLL